jgi:hypothetical protein
LIFVCGPLPKHEQQKTFPLFADNALAGAEWMMTIFPFLGDEWSEPELKSGL